MLGSLGVVVEVFGVVSGQEYDEEVANMMNVKIWEEGSVLEYEPHCVAKTRGKISTPYRHAGGGTQMPIQRKILRWKQIEGEV